MAAGAVVASPNEAQGVDDGLSAADGGGVA